MDLDHKVIGAWLRRARKRQRLTIKEMSERSGYSESFLSYLERGGAQGECGGAVHALHGAGHIHGRDAQKRGQE